jgi:hypothetical protein
MVASRLLTVLNINNTKEQFATIATIGCHEALHCLRSTLALRRLHKKEICVIFVDLIRDFDTVNHDLLFKLLLKCGIPEELVGEVS